MTELFKAALLGVIQGITEFLPISSTGHLILAEHSLGISQETYGLSFDAALHLGTLMAIFWFFRHVWLQLLSSIIRINPGVQSDNKNKQLIKLLLIGTVPAVVLGLLFEDVIDTLFRSPQLVAASLIIFSGALYFAEKVGRKYKGIVKLSLVYGLLIGTAQAVALIPGVSRSGITIAAGMWRNLQREEAARFTFLLSAPIVAGAGVLKLLRTVNLFINGGLSRFNLLFFGVGILSAAISGYLTIKYLLKFLVHHTLYPFIIYRIILGFIVLGIVFIR